MTAIDAHYDSNDATTSCYHERFKRDVLVISRMVHIAAMADESYQERPRFPPRSSDKSPGAEPPVIDVDALLPPAAMENAGVEDSAALSSSRSNSIHEASKRAHLLAAEPRSQRRFRKNVVAWLLCTLILVIAALLLVYLGG